MQDGSERETDPDRTQPNNHTSGTEKQWNQLQEREEGCKTEQQKIDRHTERERERERHQESRHRSGKAAKAGKGKTALLVVVFAYLELLSHAFQLHQPRLGIRAGANPFHEVFHELSHVLGEEGEVVLTGAGGLPIKEQGQKKHTHTKSEDQARVKKKRERKFHEAPSWGVRHGALTLSIVSTGSCYQVHRLYHVQFPISSGCVSFS